MERKEMTFDVGQRESALLENETVSVMINKDKSMVSQLSARKQDGWVNAHWQPWFRSTEKGWDEAKHAPFYQVPLLKDIAGNFLCAPNFGPPHTFEGTDYPAHGFTSAEEWEMSLMGDMIGVKSSLKSPHHPFLYKKWDLIPEKDPIHYTRLDITNEGPESLPCNVGWHNTVGAPFLEKGCLIDNNARRFMIPPEGTEFDDTGLLKKGGTAESLENVPTRDGGRVNLREVPGVTGYTDFIAGAVPQDAYLGWSSIVNPSQKLIYLTVFPGPRALKGNQITLGFYDLWMNYGGRHFSPWAPGKGLKDRSFCLGAETATGYFANGLADSVAHPELLGNPTYYTLGKGETKSLFFATLYFHYHENTLDKGVEFLETTETGLVINGRGGRSMKLRIGKLFSGLNGLQ